MSVQKNFLWHAPWPMKPAEAKESFIAVTEINRKNAVVIGRILYFIQQAGMHYTYMGFMTVDPCYFKGWWRWPFVPFAPNIGGKIKHFRVFLDNDKSRDEWAVEYKLIIDNAILKNELFIKPTDPILTYTKE